MVHGGALSGQEKRKKKRREKEGEKREEISGRKDKVAQLRRTQSNITV